VRELDETTAAGAAAATRLRADLMAWITTVRPDGQPQASAVWFHWDGTDLLVMSQPAARKVRNVRGNPRVSVNLDGDGLGGGLVIIEGTAEVLAEVEPARLEPYRAKYERHMRERLNWDPAAMLARYSTPLRVRPTRWRLA
jgi:PPOX class probable F420-dependent enzyme